MSTHAAAPDTPDGASVFARLVAGPAPERDGAAATAIGTAPREADRPNRRSTAAIDVLSRRLNGVCTHAVSPLELAAALEAQGINDAISRDKYGCDDVFALAGELYTRVPLRISSNAVRQRTLQSTGTSIARGALFALPGLFFLLVAPLFRSPVAAVAVLTAVTVGWGLSQVLAIVGYTLMGRGDRSAAGKVLGLTLIAGLAAMSAAAITVFFTGSNSDLASVCCTQILYVMSATVLLLFGRDGWLWVCLLPGVGFSGAYLLGNPLSMPREVAIGGVVVAMVATIAAALHAADREFLKGTRADARLGRPDAYTAAQYGVYGMLVAVCLAAPMMREALGDTAGTSLIGVAALPLVLSMGVAEWQQVRYSELRFRAKRSAYDMESFAETARRGLLVSAGVHIASLIVLTLLTAAVIATVGSLTAPTVIMLGAYFLLGAALFASVLLLGWGRIATVMPVFIATAVAMWALLFAVPGVTAQLGAYTGAGAVLMATLFALAFREVNNLTNHDG
jgi:hypothetical protein